MTNQAPIQSSLATTISNFEGAQAPANGNSSAGYAINNSLFTVGFSDADGNSNGIAITGVDGSKGILWYTIDSGATWQQVSGVSADHALLLSGATNRLYYQAKQTADGNLNYNGTNTGVFTYRAWDQTSGSNGGYGDTTVNGGASAFSAVERSVNGLMVDVNDAPTLSLTKVQALVNDSHAVNIFTNAVVGAGQGDTNDNALIKQMILTVKNVKNAALEVVRVDNTNIQLVSKSLPTQLATAGSTYKITVLGSTATITLSTTTGWTEAQASALINNMTYSNSSTNNTVDGTRQFSIASLTDKGSVSTVSNPYAGQNYTVITDTTLTSTVTLDKTKPNAPTAPSVPENAGGGITYQEAQDGTTVTVSLSGTNAVVGDTLTVLLGNATAATYTLTTNEISTLSATITIPQATLAAAGYGATTISAKITDIAGNVSPTSATTAITLLSPNNLPTGAVTISGTPNLGSVLTVSDTLADADGLGAIAYKWQVSSNGGATWSDISGATASTFTLTSSELGKTLRAVASYTDGAGNAESVASSATSAASVGSPTVTLGTGVSNGATSAEAQAGAVNVTAVSGTTIQVTFSDGAGHNILKTVTATGSAQPVALNAGELATLNNGSISVSAVATLSSFSSSATTSSFTLDTSAPTAPASAPTGYNDNVGAITNTASVAATTDDTTPGIFVGANLTDTPNLYVDGVKVAATYDSTNGWLTPDSALTSASHSITYTLSDAAGNESAQSPALSLTVDAIAPVFSSGATANAPENATAAYDATADSDSGITYTLVGNADDALFDIDASTGVTTFKAAPNFEAPTDAGTNNVYNLTVRATDAAGNFTDKAVAVSVTDVNEAPVLDISGNVNYTSLGWVALWGGGAEANTLNTYSTSSNTIDFSTGPSAAGKAQVEVVFDMTDYRFSSSGGTNYTAPAVWKIYITDSQGNDTLYATITGSTTGYANGTGQFTITYANGATGTLNGTSATQGLISTSNTNSQTTTDHNGNDEHMYTLLIDLPGNVASTGAVKFTYDTQGTDGAGTASASDDTVWLQEVRVYNHTALPATTSWNGSVAIFDSPAGAAQVTYTDGGTSHTVQLEPSLGWNGWRWEIAGGGSIPVSATNVVVTATASHDGHYAFWSEGSTPVSVVTANLSVTDVDAGSHLESATVKLSNAFSGDQLTISGSAVTNGATGTISANGTTLNYSASIDGTTGAITVTVTGTSSVATYRAALQKIGFTNNSENPTGCNPAIGDFSNERNIEITVNDGVNNSNTAINKIYVNAINDRPTTTQASVTLSAVAEDTAAPAGDTVANLFGGAYADAEGGTMSGVMVTANAATAGQGTWQWYDTSNSTWTTISTSLSISNAQWFTSDTQLRFVPANNYSGTPGALTARVADNTIRSLTNGSTHNIDASSPAGWGWDGPTDALSSTSVTLGTSITAVNDAPTGTVSVSGTPAVGQTLTASNTLADPDGSISGLGYQWQVSDGSGGWTNITNATNATFVLTNAEQGKAVRAVATYSDGTFSNTANSTATAAVAAGSGTIINPVPADAGTPPENYGQQIVSTGTDGSYAITWYGKDAGSDTSIYVQKYNADGTARGAQVKLEGDNLTSTGDASPYITALGTSGQYVVTWYAQGDTTGSGTDYSVFVQKFNADGTKAGSQSRVEFGGLSNAEFYTRITNIGTDGSFVVGFSAPTSNQGYVLQRFDSTGAATGSPIQLSSGTTVRLSSLTTLPDGGFVVAYEAQPSGSSYYTINTQKFAADGTALNTLQTYTSISGASNSYTAINPQVKAVGSSGAYVLVYTDWVNSSADGAIYVRTFNSSGVAGTPVRLDMSGVSNRMDDEPNVTSVGTDGSFVVAWRGDNASGGMNICLQKFNADGTTSGSQLVLASPGGNTASNYSPKMVTMPDGSFVLTWYGNDSATAPNNDYSIYIQKISKDMVVTGDVLKLEATGTTTGNDYSPEIAVTKTDGSFAITWQGQDASGNYQIYFREFAAGELDPPTLVSATPLDNSYVAASSDITLTFAAPVTLGSTGTITLQSLDGGSNVTINMASLGSNAVTVSGNTVTINPGSDLLQGKNYAVQIGTGVIKGANGVSYTLADTTTLNFGTIGADGSVAPVYNPGAAGSYLGHSLNTAGDVNGDGIDDYIVGAPGTNSSLGAAYVVYGNTAGTLPVLTNNSIASSTGFMISGQAGWFANVGNASAAGDVNGDGYADLIVSGYNTLNSTYNTAFVVYGGTANAGGINLSSGSIASSQGFAIAPIAGTAFTGAVSGMGDFNGDGLADLLIRQGSGNNNSSAKDVYVVYGNTTGATVSLASLSATQGLKISSVAYDTSIMALGPQALSGAGDVNGDGLADVIIGADLLNSGYGAAYVVYGTTNSAGITMTNMATSQGFKILGDSTVTGLGQMVSSAGDINGDGLADLVVGTSGKTFVVYGNSTGTDVNLSGGNIASSQGFKINGAVGWNVSGIGDVNGDGLADVITGDYANNIAYVIYGNASGTGVDVIGGSIASSQGFKITGQTGAQFGFTVAGLGDINGDGLADIGIGAKNTNSGAGAYSVIFGGSQTISNAVRGSGAVTGTSASEVIIGSTGADTLTGGGGTDRFYAGDGNDTIVIGASDVTALADNTAGSVKALINGGGDYDTLRLTGNGTTLDLTTIRNAGGMGVEENSRLEGIERIDLATDTGAQTLTLTATDVNDMAGMNLIRLGASADGNTWASGTYTLGATSKYHQLVVDGTAADGLVLAAGNGGWANMGTVTNSTTSTTYNVYQNDTTNSQVFVKSGVVVTNNDPIIAPITVGTPVLTGGAASDNLGYAISYAGDVNGDGIDDFIVGAPWADPNGRNTSGASYVVFGKVGGVPTVNATELASGSSTNGFVINGALAPSTSGISVSYAGDVNSDGLADLLVGAYQENVSAGAAYLVYGKASGSAVDLATVTTTNSATGQKIAAFGGTNTNTGYSVSNAGDINGDGLADVLVTNYDSVGGYISKVLLGSSNGLATGFTITGDGTNAANRSISNAGDVNGDGLADIVVGADVASGSGAYVVFGKTSTTNITITGNTNGFAIVPESNLDGTGVTISNAGDVNGDGLADLIVGAYLADPTSGYDAGKTYVVFGKTSNAAVNLSALTSASNTQGFIINGQCASDSSGYRISYAGDINGDGLADLIVGAYTADSTTAADVGKAYVVYGKADGSSVNLSAIAAGSGGFVIIGESASDRLSSGVSYAGDVNGDGYSDLAVGAYLKTTAAGANAGAAYIIYGGPQYTGSNVQAGTTGADTLAGTSGADRFYAGAGADTIILDPADVAGFASATTRAYVDGGEGFDTLQVSGSGVSLDLTAIKNVSGMAADGSSRINSIERINLGADATANTLTLTATDVNDMAGMNLIHTTTASADGKTWTNVSGTALAATTKYHQLVVDGTASDIVNLKTGGTWANAGTVNDGTSNYTVYQNATTNSQVIVKSGVTVNMNVAPVVLDLNGDGVLSYTQTRMDVNSDGVMDTTAWAGAQDGVLVWDKYADGVVHDASQYELSQYGGKTDLEGLAAGFDSNADGVFDANDAKFGEFAVWQDVNGNGASDAGEVQTLSAWGVTSINLSSDGVVRSPAVGVTEAGETTAQTNGGVMLVGDVAFSYVNGVWVV